MMDQQILEESSRALDAAYRGAFRVAGLSVEVSGQRSDDVTLVPSLEPSRVSTTASDIDVWVESRSRIDDACGQLLFDSGSTWRLYAHDFGFRFDFYAVLH